MTDTESAQESGSSMIDEAKEKTSDVADQAKERLRDVSGVAKDTVTERSDQGSTQAGKWLGRTSHDLREVGDTLRGQGKGTTARLTDQAATQVQKLGSYMESSSPQEILQDVAEVARRNPWAFALGGLVLGFAASRFIRQSAEVVGSNVSSQRTGFEDDSFTSRQRLEGHETDVYGEAPPDVYGTRRAA